MSYNKPRVAVLIPCYNEAAAIKKVISEFRKSIPVCEIYVYDNNSNDNTVEVATKAGAIVRKERLQGKGYVVHRMFADVEADIYLLVDGDDTYDAGIAPRAIRLLQSEQLDMVNISRDESSAEAYRRGHKFGNIILTSIVGIIFGRRIRDMLSGYRVFSRRYVKSFPTTSAGFEIETELTVHALNLEMPIREISAPYKERVEGSESKLNTYRDGFRILKTIAKLVKDERPFLTFSLLAVCLFFVSLMFGVPVILEFMNTGLVPRIPTAVLSLGIMIMSFLSMVCGLILDTVTQGRKEFKRLAYLSYPAIENPVEEIQDDM